VIELADPAANNSLMGASNGDYVSWYFTFARTELVIGFDPKSHLAPAFKRVQQHKLPWYKALSQPGLRLGRTDPNLDPKGYRAIWAVNLAQKLYHLDGFKRRLLGTDQNSSQIFPEEVLVARMLTGQLDAGVFYLSEARELRIPFIRLPAKINLGSAADRKIYSTQHFTTSNGVRVTGAPIQYSITIPRTVKNIDGAEAFVRFVLSRRVRAIASAHGLIPIKTSLGGDRNSVPTPLMRFIGQK
jgi:molybdate/tungstate transport system substrate-binding protein